MMAMWWVMVVVMVEVAEQALTLHSPVLLRRTDKVEEVEEEWKKQARIGGVLFNPLQFKFPRAPHLRVVAESWPPHVKVSPGEDGAAATVEGPMAALLEAVAASLNFTYTIVQGDGYWGAPTDNGTWNGMIGMVMRKEVDMGLGPFGVSHARHQVVGFTMPIFREVLHVLTARPRPQPEPWGFIAPFTRDVWAVVLACMVVVTVVAAAAARLLTTPGSTHKDPSCSSLFLRHLFAHYQLLAGQALHREPMKLTPRLMLCLWLIAVFILMRAYSGALTSLMAVKRVEVKYDSLQDALNDPSMILILEGSTALTGLLQTATDGVFGELAAAVRSRGMQVKASKMLKAAISLLPDGHHAMFIERIGCNKLFSDYFSSTGRCDFYFSRGVFWPLLYSIVLPLRSPLLPLIDARILAMSESNVYEVWARAMTPNLTHCLSMPTKLKFDEPYSLQNLWAVFLLLGTGTVAAMGIFLMELLLWSV